MYLQKSVLLLPSLSTVIIACSHTLLSSLRQTHSEKKITEMSASEDYCYDAGSNSVAFVTTPDEHSAKKLARGIIEQKLAACVNIIPQIQSIYMWEGKVTEDSEYLMMIKTRTSRIDDLTRWVRENHSYSVAEVIALPIQQGNAPYLKWISQTLNQKDNLPSVICEKCVQRLNVTYNFIKLAKASDANLRAFINKVGQDFQQFTKTNSPLKEQQCYDEAENNLENQQQNNKIQTKDEDEEENSEMLKNFNHNIKSREISFSNSLEEVEIITETDLPTDNANNIQYFIENATSKFAGKGKFLAINNNSTNSENNDIKNEELENEDTEDLQDVDNGAVYLEDYEALLEEGEFIDENTEEEQERKFMHEMVLYDNDDPICDNTENDVKIRDTIEQNQEFVITTATKSAGKTDITGVEKPKRRRTNKPSTGTEARFICTTCNRDFISLQNLNRHLRAHEGKKRFVCKECGKSFSQNGSLKQHSYTHTGERPYKCATCNRGFTQWKSLSFHMRRHTGEKPFPCEYCGVAFRQKDGLKTHLMKHHLTTSQSGNTEKHVCSLCKKVLSTKKLLAEHVKRHLNKHKDVTAANLTEDSQFNSEVVVEYINEDEEHLIEEEELPVLGDILASATHVVDVGDTSAADPVRAKKYQCRICFKSFAIMKNLIRHVSIHNSNIYQCTKCNLAFESNYALNFHRMQKHKEIGVNLNVCEECQLNYQTDNELDEHLRSVHGLMCAQCPELTFKTRNALLEHQVDHEDILAEYN